jgi:N-acyl-D-amino-acid deacylase
VIDTSTYAEPVSFPIGIEHVFVNGVHAVRDGQETGNLGGRALRREVPAQGTTSPSYMSG